MSKGALDTVGRSAGLRGPGLRQMAVGDLDLDGRPDFAVVSATTGAGATPLHVVLNRTSGASVSGSDLGFTLSTASDPLYSVTVGDWNNDGKPDLLLGAGANGTVVLLLNTST